jgi:hypothetical protein
MTPEEVPLVSATTSERIERKYPVCVAVLDNVVHEMKAIRPIYRYGPGDWSSIRTTYLDTVGYQCYQEYLQDLPVRRKVRIRQYGVNGKFDDTCWFEVKLKNARVSMKRRFRCTLQAAARLLKGENVLDEIGPADGSDLRHAYHLVRGAVMDQNLAPVVRVDYERISFQSPDDLEVRITLDRQVRFRSAARDHQGRLEGLVLEVKYTGQRPLWLPEVQERLGMKRELRYSKFGRSMKLLSKMRDREGRP